jgi:hypothetical protein
MARQRGNVVERDTTTGGTTRMAQGIETLNQAEIDELLASSKQRGEYDRQLKAFVESAVAGVQVSLTEGPFQGKKPQTVKTGFDGAIKREGAPAGAENVRVISHDDKIYLLNQNTEQEAA